MGNKQETPKFYNKDFVNKESSNKTGKAREIKEDPSPKTYTIPDFQKREDCVYLKVVSWNLNMEAHSSYASSSWIYSNNKWDLVYAQCEKQDADIITFQELPKAYYGMHANSTHKAKNEEAGVHPLIQKYLDTNNWYITFSPSSHCGYTLVLVHKRCETQFDIDYQDTIDPEEKFPGIVLSKKSVSDSELNDADTEQKDAEKKPGRLMLFGCHLHPWKGEVNAAKRRKQIDRLYQVAVERQLSDYFVLLGDTNMRYDEEVAVVQDYDNNRLSCCWQIVPDAFKKNCMFTWYRNYFEVGAEGASRFDKVFYGAKIKCVEVSVFDETVSDDKYHFLSDHRGVSVVLEIHND